MMLSMEEVQKIKNDWNHPYMCKNELWDERVNNLFDTIEALQQENEQLKAELSQWSYLGDIATTELIAERLHYIPTLKHENEQLRAQVATLKNIKEMLHECMAVRMMPDKVERVVNDALAEIDKAIGGGQDAMLSVQR